jgi:hypothetical protein
MVDLSFLYEGGYMSYEEEDTCHMRRRIHAYYEEEDTWHD